MSETSLKIDLDPKKVIASLQEMAKQSKELQDELDKSFKKSGESIESFENKAEKGTTKVGKFFRDLSQRVRGDLKTAFDVASVVEGAKFVNEMSQGVKQVFEMERAFDRMNTRLGLSRDKLEQFKKQMTGVIAETGQQVKDILPGVEMVSAKSGMTDPDQLSKVASILGQVKTATGEDPSGMADSIIEIMKNQGIKINADSFAKVSDAVQGTRVNGAFKSADEAADAIKAITQSLSKEQMKEMGLGTREVGGLAAMASNGGEQGQSILQSILKDATTAGGKEKLNAIFGSGIFKNGKLDTGALGNVDEKRFGQYSEQIMGGAANVDQAALQRFLTSMKDGKKSFDSVVSGQNETAKQFETSSQSLSFQIDRFKARLTSATGAIGGDLTEAVNNLVKGDMSAAMKDLGEAFKSAWENKGTIASGVGASVGVGMLMGGGMSSLLSKIPGGGLLQGAAGGALADAAGIQKVYVVNASEIGGGGIVDKTTSLLAGVLPELGLLASSLGAIGATSVTALAGAGAAGLGIIGAGVAGAGAVGYGAGTLLNKTGLPDYLGEKAQSAFGKSDAQYLEEAMAKGAERGVINAKKGERVQFTSNSKLEGRH